MTAEPTRTEVTADDAKSATDLWRKTKLHDSTVGDLSFALNWALKCDSVPADLKDLTVAAAAAVESAEKAIEALRSVAAGYYHRPCRLTATNPALINASLVRREADESRWYPHPAQRGMWVNADSGQLLTAAALLASGDLITEPGA